MKNKLYIALGLVALMATACTSIEEYPDGRMDRDQIFSNQKLTGAYVNSCYDGLYKSIGHIYGTNSFISGVTDDAMDVDNTNNGAISQWNSGALTPFANPLGSPSIWDNYTWIRRCNVALHELPTANIHSEEVRNQYIGEVHTLRALYYMQLLKTYGGVPIVLDNVSEQPDPNATYTVATPAAVARQIIADCKAAIEIADLGWHPGSSDKDNYRMSKGVAAAVMSEAALFAASPLNADGTFTWDEAAQITKEALDLCLDNGYALYTAIPSGVELNLAYTAYDLYFLSDYDVNGSVDKETLQGYRGNYQVWCYHGLPITNGQSRAGTCPSQELIDCYETIDGQMPILGYADDDHLQPIINSAATLYDENDPYANRDPRLRASIYYHGSPANPVDPESAISMAEGGNCAISASNVRNTRTGYYLRKFGNPTSQRGNQADGPLRAYRLAELYLNYAEALLESSSAATAPMEAVSAVNKIRQRVGMPGLPYSITKDEFRTRLRNERRIELAFEDNRYYDVRRWKILDQTGKVVTGMRPVIDSSTGAVSYERFVADRRASYSDKFLRFPIPGDEAVRLGLTNITE